MSRPGVEDDYGDDEYRGERLQRVLAQRGVASRRRSEELITAGQVQVNGKTVTELGTRADPVHDEIRVNGKLLQRQAPRYIMLNKPSGFITTVSDERDRWTVMDLVDVRERVYPVGRLDRATQGLVLLTNDGDLAHRIMHPRYRVDKEYLVFTDSRPTEQQLQRLRDGVRIDDHRVVPHDVRLFRESTEGVAIRIVIHEGLYHVVRRMMEAVGIPVTRLRRTRLGPLQIHGVPAGAWRDLTPGELIELYRAVGLPGEGADRANSERAMQLTPVGGYTHPSAAASDGGRATRTEGTTPRPVSASGERRGRPASSQGRRGDRQARDRADSSRGRGSRHDSSRSSPGHRHRRTGRRG